MLTRKNAGFRSPDEENLREESASNTEITSLAKRHETNS
jgi:hypothetical protein